MLPARSGLDLRALRTTVYTGGVTAKLTDEDWASQTPNKVFLGNVSLAPI